MKKPLTLGMGVDNQEKIDEIINGLELSRPVTLESVGTVPRGMKFFYEGNERFTRIYGAADSPDIPVQKLKEMTDPYTSTTRKAFEQLIYDDPIGAPAFEKRVNASYENGFELVLELAHLHDKKTGKRLTEEEQKLALESAENIYLPHLQRLRDWSESPMIDLESRMRESLASSLNQGRTAVYFTPGLTELAPGQLPIAMEVINRIDLGNPIIDTALTHKMVGVKTSWETKKFVRADEMVYIVQKMLGLRKDNAFFGASLFESVLTISKTIKRIYNYDIPEAMIAAYITKVIFQLSETGTQSAQENTASDFLRDFLTTGKLAYVINHEIANVHQVPVKTDSAMIDTLESKIADLMLGVIGTPKSMMNREHNLNRDIATIQAIQFVKFIRKPDERHIASAFEMQLLNQLMAHLAGQTVNQMPVRAKIRALPSPDGELVDDLASKKQDELNSESLTQTDSQGNTFGAYGNPKKRTVRKVGNNYVVS